MEKCVVIINKPPPISHPLKNKKSEPHTQTQTHTFIDIGKLVDGRDDDDSKAGLDVRLSISPSMATEKICNSTIIGDFLTTSLYTSTLAIDVTPRNIF